MPTSLSLSIPYCLLSAPMYMGKVPFVFPYVWILDGHPGNLHLRRLQIRAINCLTWFKCTVKGGHIVGKVFYSMDSMTFVIYVWNSERWLSPPGWSALFMLLDVNHGKNWCHVLPQHWQISTGMKCTASSSMFHHFQPFFFQFNRESTHYNVAYKEAADDLTKDD